MKKLSWSMKVALIAILLTTIWFGAFAVALHCSTNGDLSKNRCVSTK